MSESGPTPLAGIRVIDFSQVMLGPCATQLLADYGADVIKIERPEHGDLSRSTLEDPLGLDNPVFLSLNRNKRSVAADLRDPAVREAIDRLIDTADVVTSNFRAGVMERLGLGYERLSARNPKLVWASASGFGSTGPLVGKGGQDVIAQAYTGVMMRKPDPDHPVAIYPTTLADYSAGMHLAQGILLALLERDRTGRGGVVEVSLYDSMLSMQMQEATVQLMRSMDLNWAQMPLTGCFATTDGTIALVGAFKENPLRSICSALELPDLSAERRFATLVDQRANRTELQRILRLRFAENGTAYWLARLEAEDLLCAPVRTLGEALADDQTAHNDMVLEFEHPKAGRMSTVASPIRMNGVRPGVRLPPPALGQDTDEVLGSVAEALS
ncbi:formyl-CoA transferase [Actinophytocola xinjiangensis]|uniref:Formyl-CoA transferase n=1 Tax=Actinophytocola xinjiangensis TaxID=485602 RepID=A0A7Z0WJ36_9PSEU|nr:CoA transferase [Actinophytocola xinjiangensis]OLF07323.1 formyl-CoA transferase [Actinophytocola xinjiangensis]